MGREGVKRKKIFCGQHLKKIRSKNEKREKYCYFSSGFVGQGGGSHEIFNLFSIWGVKFCLRQGDCVLGGQPMGIPPYPSPCPCVTSVHFPVSYPGYPFSGEPLPLPMFKVPRS